MIVFFKSKSNKIVAVQFTDKMNESDLPKLNWLLDGEQLKEVELSGFFIGPRAAMVSPWSTNAVEITQNMTIDNIVRITNLPNKCNVSIYTVSGTLIRQLIKDDNNPFINWNLKTEGGLNIASGAYLIHVEAEGIGEKVIKFFGVMRPLDIDTF